MIRCRPRSRSISLWVLRASGALVITASPAAAQKRPLTITDIVETRSIDSLTVSPDGAQIAFRVISPSVARNLTTAQWYRVPLSGERAGEPLGPATEPIWMPIYDMVEDGVRQWDWDSRSLFVLQQSASAVQVHRLGPGGSDAAVTSDPADVVSFSLTADGRRIAYQVRGSRDEIAQAQTAEEKAGIHLDRTLFTEGLRLTENYRLGARRLTMRRISAAGIAPVGAGPLRDKQVDALPSPASSSKPTVPSYDSGNIVNAVTDPNPGRSLAFGSRPLAVHLVESAAAPDDGTMKRYHVEATLPGGVVRRCRADFCSGLSAEIRELTINEATSEAVILFEPGFSARSTVYGWNPVTNATRVIYTADGSLDGGSESSFDMCPKAGPYLICVQAGPARPPRLVRIDLTSGTAVTLFDPNVDLASRAFGETSFLTWKDSLGRPSSGVLVLPPHPTYPLPIVITSYRCRGFLRGGTARLAPEHVLVQSGFASLCVGLNNAVPLERDAKGGQQPVARIKASLASYSAAIDLLVGRGMVDRSRVGIAGHSYSSNVIAYAISHSDLFAAAAIGTGVTIDPNSYYLTAPTSDSWRKDVPSVMGLPKPTADNEGVWKAVSPALNADRIRAPLLIQSPENEYLFALQLYASIQDAEGTVDMYVYPNEGHMVERQPAHQYWRARRSVDWFSFWLMGSAERKSGTEAQFDHWESLRQARKTIARNGAATGSQRSISPSVAFPRPVATPPHQPAP